MTDAELDAIRERADKATPGPWDAIDSVSRPDHWRGPSGLLEIEDGFAGEAAVCEGEEGIQCNVCLLNATRETLGKMMADAAFIAHARTNIPALLAEVERLRQENADLRLLLGCDPESHPDYERLIAKRGQ